MDGCTSARFAARLSTPLLVLAAACFAMPMVVLPEGTASGLGLATAGAHPEAAVALGLVLAALGASLTHRRHRISLLVLTAGFATTALLLLRATVSTVAQDRVDAFAIQLGGVPLLGRVDSAVQQALAVRWTAAYLAAALATTAVFLLNAWALLRQPAPARPAPPAPEAPAAAS